MQETRDPIQELLIAARRTHILDAAATVFAEKGFDGTTTRELAKAAGVSEALIYKHFPSKQSLYAAMLDACAKGPAFAEFLNKYAPQAGPTILHPEEPPGAQSSGGGHATEGKE